MKLVRELRAETEQKEKARRPIPSRVFTADLPTPVKLRQQQMSHAPVDDAKGQWRSNKVENFEIDHYTTTLSESMSFEEWYRDAFLPEINM